MHWICPFHECSMIVFANLIFEHLRCAVQLDRRSESTAHGYYRRIALWRINVKVPELSAFLGSDAEKKRSILEQLAPQRAAAEKNPAAVKELSRGLREDSFSVFLLAALGSTPMAATPLSSYRDFVEQFVSDALGERKKCPLLCILVEQLLISHFTALRLHCDAANIDDLESRRTNHMLATNLTAEIRRLTSQIDAMKASSSTDSPSAATQSPTKKLRAKNEVGSKVSGRCA